MELLRTGRALAAARRRPRHRPLAAWVGRRRGALRNAALIAVIAVVTSSLGWLTWQATAAARGPAGAEVPSGDRLVTHLEGDLTTELAARRRSDAAGSASRSESRSHAGAGGSATGGTALSAAAVTAVLVAGLAGMLVVARRHRSEQAACTAASEPEDGSSAGPDRPDRAARTGPGEDPTRPRVHPDPASGPAHPPVTDDGDLEQPPAAGPPSGTTVEVVGAASDGPAHRSPGHTGPTYSSRERLYERRSSPRIAYECEGRLRCRQDEVAVTVLDLSETGLRCRSAAALPRATSHVQVRFPLGGDDVTLSGQVSWRRAGPDGTEIGVQFARLTEQHRQRLRDTCSQPA